MSAGAVRAGGVFVEIGADPRKFFAALSRVNKSLGNMGRSLASGGGKLAAAGIGMAAPIAAAVRQGAAFESTLLNIRASTGATTAQIDQIKASSMAMSQALGVGPTEAAQGMLELLKAGMSLDAVLGGAGKTAMEFAKVGEMDVAQAAVVMSDAMNVFKVSSGVAANALSSAADASSTSIAQMSEAFSMSSAVAGLANQSIEDLSATLAILANNGVKGSDAGTSVKTMLMRLMAPADDAVGALNQLGLSVASFRGADGQMKPMVEIIGTLGQAMAGLDQTAKDDLFRRIFGADAIRAAAILADAGVEGFQSMRDAMASALPVGEKYKMLMSGLAGSAGSVLAALQRMAIAISDAVAPALASVVPFITGFIDGLTDFISKNKEAVAGFAKLAVAAIGIGGAMTSLGLSLQVTSFAMGGIGKAAMFAMSPLTMLMGTVTGVGTSFALAMPETLKLANAIGSSMVAASASVLSFAAASGSAMAGFATSSATAISGFAATSAAGFVRMSGAASAAAQAMFPVFFTGFNRGIAAGAGFFSATLRGLNGVVMASSALRGALFAVSGSAVGRFAADISNGLAFTYKTFTWWASGVTMQVSAFAANTALNMQYAAKQFTWFASGVAMQGKAYIGNLVRMAIATATSAASIVGSWIATAMPATAAFAVGAAGSIGAYIASTVAAATASVSNAARSGMAWVASALPGVAAFVGSAVAGIGSYLAATAMAVAGSVASAAAVAAAWLAPLAPLLLLSAAAVGVGAAVKQFGPQLSSAFSGLAGYVSEAGGAIAGGFSTAVADGIVVLGDLATTATTTFSGVYEAVAAGDLSGAMDLLWAGLVAGWLRGTEALMSYVDPWVAAFQDVFTDIGSGIYIAWDKIYTDSAALLNTMGAFIMGFFDNIANGVMATFDNLVAGIQIAWTRVQGFITGAKDTDKRVQAIRDKNAARAEQRRQERPGIEGRTAKAAKENAQAEKDRQDRVEAIKEDAQATKDARQAANQQRADDRRAATQAAEGRLADATTGASERRKDAASAAELLNSLASASSLDEITNIGASMDALIERGNVSGEMESKLLDAYYAAFSRVNVASASASSEQAATAGAGAAGADSATSKSEVAGTFSSVNLGGMGFGSSLAERTAKAAEETAKGVGQLVQQGAAGVAA
jgi:TP901 family phage tail tape measure protein